MRTTGTWVMIAASVLVGGTGCLDQGPRAVGDPLGVIVSGLVRTRIGTVRGGGPVVAASTPGAGVVYVSLPPATVPTGTQATITNQAAGQAVTTAVAGGGFDPVPIAASVGDTLAVEISRAASASPVSVHLAVTPVRPLKVVRTSPPSGGRDVPLNATIVIVFSEPIDPTTLTTASLQLLSDTTPVGGTVKLASSSDVIAEFQPTNLLAPKATYHLAVSEQIHTLAGVALASPLSVWFTTGTSVQAQPAAKLAFTVQPRNATSGDLLSPVVVAIQDSAGTTVTSANDLVVMRSSCAPASGCDTGATAYSLSGYIAVSAVNGVATFSQLRLAIATSGYTLVATSGTLGAATSVPFDIGPGAPVQLAFVGKGQGIVGQPLPVDVAIKDLAFNTVTSATQAVTVSLAASPPGATLAGTLTVSAVNGVAHFTDLIVNQPGTYTLTATANPLTAATAGLIAYSSGAFISVSTGGNHTCGVTTNGGAYCWGANDHGQLGDGTMTNRTTPVPVAGGLSFVEMVPGGSHTCGHATLGAWYCWGANSNGQLGDGTTSDRTTPVLVARVDGQLVGGLSAGRSHTCGSVPATRYQAALFYCWGLNDHGQLGDGTTTPRTAPTLVATMGPAAGPVIAGGNHTCAQDYDTGNALCWGANGNGQLDDGTTIDRLSPVAIETVPCGSGPPGFVPPVACPPGAFTVFNGGFTAGGAHTCAGAGGSYYTSFAWYCWGANGSGQVGDGTTTDRAVWVLVDGGRAFGWVSAGGNHTCGLPTGPGHVRGDVYCWGSNSNGQLGDGTTTQRTRPVLVAGGLSFLGVSAGGNHSCGVTAAGLYCWGSNSAGQLGTGSTTDSSVPVKVAGQP